MSIIFQQSKAVEVIIILPTQFLSSGDSEHLGHPDEGQPADGDGDGEPGREGGDGQEFQDFQEVSEGGVG